MPYRPTAVHRRNIRGVIYPLTASVAQIYGIREDGAYPIGAFYTVNIDSTVWEHISGIWYRPYTPIDVEGRSIREEDIKLFSNAVINGGPITLRSGKRIDWELIPETEAGQLPRP
jgi:hypothetical protein